MRLIVMGQQAFGKDESRASHERRRTKRHVGIDRFKPVGRVYDLIRGANPAPGAWTTRAVEELGVFDCARVPGDGVAGRIMSVDDDGVTVQGVGGRILVKRVKPVGGAKVVATEWARANGLSVGDSLGTWEPSRCAG